MNIESNLSLKHLSQHDLLTFGLNAVAYLRPTTVDGQPVFAIHAADGSQLAFVATREVGIAAMQQHDLEPVWLN